MNLVIVIMLIVFLIATNIFAFQKNDGEEEIIKLRKFLTSNGEKSTTPA